MIPNIKDHVSFRRRDKHVIRKLLLLPAAGIFMACASCSEAAPKQPPVTVTDTKPVGEGLTVVGFAIVGAAVVVVLGRLLR